MSESDPPGRHRLERYLLGDLPDEERAAIEQKYFADDDEFERVIEAHNDLVDSYARGALTGEERARFERRYLSSDAEIERVEFARSLARATRPRRPAVLRIAVAASVALIALTAWFFFASRRREVLPAKPSAEATPRSTNPQVVTETGRKPAISKTTAREKSSAIASEAAAVTVVLTPHGTRETDRSTDLMVRPATQWIQIELVLDDGRYESYGVELQDVDGHVFWSEAQVRPDRAKHGRVVAARVPARVLPAGDYVVILRGPGTPAAEISNYTFTVIAGPAK